MKVSIITHCLNAEATIRDTIRSVLGQTYPDIEYIIIDGKSSDRTIDIIKEYSRGVDCLVSEPDKGIYNAMNKGIRLASGELIGILNADDLYADNSVIQEVVAAIKQSKADVCWGDLLYINRGDASKVTRVWRSSSFPKKGFYSGWMPPHPTFFVKKEVYKKYGLFREDLLIAADYELMLRFLQKEKVKGCYLPKIIVKMKEGGASDWKNAAKVLKANLECCRAFKINNLKPSPFLLIKKPLLKTKQLFNKKYDRE